MSHKMSDSSYLHYFTTQCGDSTVQDSLHLALELESKPDMDTNCMNAVQQDVISSEQKERDKEGRTLKFCQPQEERNSKASGVMIFGKSEVEIIRRGTGTTYFYRGLVVTFVI